jgi:hypothetical protein
VNHSSSRFRFPWSACWLLTALLPGICGCGNSSDIREYVVERENEKVFTSDLLRSEFATIPLNWKVPASWQTADNDQFSTMAWETGPKGKEARITVSALPAAAGVPPQIIRWRRQIGLSTEGVDPMQDAETITLQNDPATYVDMAGDTDTILGMILPHEDKLWIFKLKAPNAVADKARDDFRGYCESIRIVRTAGE